MPKIAPEISILMPLHNEEKYLMDCIESIKIQTFKNFELIIIDDGSTDRTPAILRSLLDDPKITVILSDKVGKNVALNRGYAASIGNWITFFSGDDLMSPQSLEARMNVIKDLSPVDEKVITYARCRMFSEDERFNGVELPKDKSLGSDSASMMMFSRKLAEIIFPLPKDLPNEDQWTSLTGKYFSDYKIHIPEIVTEYRIHSNNSHRRDLNFDEYSKQYHERFIVYEKFLSHHQMELTDDAKKWLSARAKLEDARINQQIGTIITTRIDLKEKIRALIYSNALLYKLRLRFYRYFSGW